MQLPIYQFDAFTDRRFGGNPAAVVIAQDSLSDSQMQAIAQENNLSETAFVTLGGNIHKLRWFTPEAEVELCGHATLAAAACLRANQYDLANTLVFATCSGDLTATFEDDSWALDFPALALTAEPLNSQLAQSVSAALGVDLISLNKSQGLVAEVATAEAIQHLKPDLALVASLDSPYVCITAPGEDCDFVSRVFAPRIGIPEDPVTGSAHCALTPFWHTRTGRHQFFARQLSSRGGEIHCTLVGQRVILRGNAVPYLAGHIWV